MKVSSAIILVIVKSIIFTIIRFFGFAPPIPSPKVRVRWGDVKYIAGEVIIKNMPSVYPISPQDTKSMLPMVGMGNQALMTTEFSIEDLEEGDGIHYRIPGHSNFHLIAGIFRDKKSWFCICKGANCFFPDPFAIREKDIVSLMRGVIF